MVVVLCYRSYRGSGVLARCLLFNGDGRGEALDGIYIGLVQLLQELAGIGREGLYVTALAFGVEGVKGEGGFAGPADARDDDELVPGDLDGDVLQVVFSGAFDDDVTLNHRGA